MAVTDGCYRIGCPYCVRDTNIFIPRESDTVNAGRTRSEDPTAMTPTHPLLAAPDRAECRVAAHGGASHSHSDAAGNTDGPHTPYHWPCHRQAHGIINFQQDRRVRSSEPTDGSLPSVPLGATAAPAPGASGGGTRTTGIGRTPSPQPPRLDRWPNSVRRRGAIPVSLPRVRCRFKSGPVRSPARKPSGAGATARPATPRLTKCESIEAGYGAGHQPLIPSPSRGESKDR